MPRNNSRTTGSSARRGTSSTRDTSSTRGTSGTRGSSSTRGTSSTKRSTSGRFKKTITKTPSERITSGERVPKYLKNTGKPWSDTDVKKLRDLIKINTPTRVLGLKLGRSEDSVRGKVRSIGISLKPTNRSPR